MMPGLVFKWFPLCEFSLFDTPRVSFLVVWGLGVSGLTPKAQGLISFAFLLCLVKFHLFRGCHLQRSCTQHL